MEAIGNEITMFRPFPKIGTIKDTLFFIKKNWHKFLDKQPTELNFTGTVKLHGTHADIVFIKRKPKKEASFISARDYINYLNTPHYHYQSRNRIITAQSDNNGFAYFMDKIPISNINKLFNKIYPLNNPELHQIIISGEFCGGSIQNTVALTELSKRFVITNIKVNDIYMNMNLCKDISLEKYSIYNITKAATFNCKIRLTDSMELSHIQDIEYLDSLTDQVEKECPFAKLFGISGLGEGIVWIYSDHNIDYHTWFKAKGQEHTVSKVNIVKFSQLDIDKKKNTQIFVDNTVLPNRLNQGIEYLKEMGLDSSLKNFGKFLGWITKDILTEEALTIKENKLDIKMIKNIIVMKVKKWYCMRIIPT